MTQWKYNVITVLDGMYVWMVNGVEVGGLLSREQFEFLQRMDDAGRTVTPTILQSDGVKLLGEGHAPVGAIGTALWEFLSDKGKDGWEVVGMSPITVETKNPKQRAVMLVLKRPLVDHST
jgi:hypothetical protein